ncbi:membrane-bound PQQ-dependent dehydrogenase, glucose/quinate/shikimate family [Pseudomonas saliphila]|uniref:membrane-bound PQQ-dependent dehydrogenase, glucose/quinate/shikimate family n=1 Tax=Pseudomonas saliphila TaxID=2586906 RepID=UPI0015B70828|nr:membrane-bound PQQ-dependent dehydrogenase, glucose/quinate/shikimate family [Pseudomonas saliphila]
MQRKPGPFLARWMLLLAAFVALLVSLSIALPGIWLAMLGGSFYYAIAGAAGALACLWILSGRYASGVGLFAMVTIGTLLWALWEIDLKAWMHAWGFDLAGRTGLHLGLLLVMLLALAFISSESTRRSDHGLAAMILGIPLLLVALVAGGGYLVRASADNSQASAVAATDGVAPVTSTIQSTTDPEEWIAFGGTNQGQRFSTADQITPENVALLTLAWEFHTGDLPPNERVTYAFQNAPLKIGNSLFVCSNSNQVFALDPATGQAQWHFDPRVSPDAMESMQSVACRAVAYHETANASEDGKLCSRRVLLATADSRLIALDAPTGEQCRGFGNSGTVDLGEGLDSQETGFSSSTSGPAVVGDLVIVGQQISDNQRRDAPSGVTRAYSATTGELVWAWDAKRVDRPRHRLGPGEIWPRGTPNVWTVISADEQLGLVYLATGSPANDHWGGDRSKEEEAYTAAVVAVDARTGDTRWHFRTVDHDLWNYDLGAQPTLTDMEIEGEWRRVLLQGTKSGSIYVLDASSGEPLTPIERRATPQGTVEGDWTSATQQYSTGFPNFAGAPGREPELIAEEHLFGLTPLDALFCRIQFKRMRYEGIYTPPTDQGDGTLVFPGSLGGLTWGSLSVNPEQQILITNSNRLPNRVKLYPRGQVLDPPVGSGGARPDQRIAPQAGAPFGVDNSMWLSPLGVPCVAPPWGFLSATDMRTGQLLWSQPLGTAEDAGPLGIASRVRLRIGMPNLGGAVNTRSGLTFIAAARDNYLRAFDTRTGEQLWNGRLPAGGQAPPITYTHAGRQYVAIASGGDARLDTSMGDSVVVFALPQ